MSYLSFPRLTFSGLFEADPSTVNNDVRHYANDFFEPRFQEPTQPLPPGKSFQNGWWNPSGTGAFRLLSTRVVQAVLGPGQSDAAAVGLALNAQTDSASAQLVDLDPQMQTASMIYGLRVILSRDGVEIMRGDYRPSPFRDLFFGRLAGGGGSSGASAQFTSVLTNVTWAADMPDLEVLRRLQRAAVENGDTLSVNFTTTLFNHFGTHLGRLLGAIGPWSADAPRTFVTGRRLAPVTPGAVATPAGIGAFDAELAADRTSIAVDFSNALPIAMPTGLLKNLGELSLAVLTRTDPGSADQGFQAGIAEGAVVPASDLTIIGPVQDYAGPDWLAETAGVVDFTIPDTAQKLIADHPLALVVPTASKDQFRILIRETIAGYALRAEDFVIRQDTAKDTAATTSCQLYATRWGAPAAGLPIRFSLNPPQSGQGGGDDSQDAAPPQATIPDIGPTPGTTPAVSFAPGAVTGPDGVATIEIFSTDPGNPRGYLDGQIYQVNYQIAILGLSPLAIFDAIFLHVREAYEAPAQPDWQTDIAPFMQQYDNLYPVMSRNLFSLADPAVAAQHAHLLIFAFERPLDDPNHMPATRDLSAGKRQAMVRWLSSKLQAPPAPPPAPPGMVALTRMPGPAPIARLQPLSNAVIDAALAQLGDGDDGKTSAMRTYLLAQRTD